MAAEPTVQWLFDLTGKVSPVTGAGHHGVMLDQMEPASLEAGFAGAVAAIGRIDVLVNNGHEALSQDWTDVTHEAFSRQRVNASGYFMRRGSSGSAP